MLPVFAGIVRTMAVRPERMAAALEEEMLATELADHLVERGVPFREAHRAVGRLVRRARELGMPLGELPLGEYRRIHPAFGDDVREVLDFRRAVGRRRSHGGTAPERVREQIALAKEMLAERRKDGE